jgi:hypothetical protein
MPTYQYEPIPPRPPLTYEDLRGTKPKEERLPKVVAADVELTPNGDLVFWGWEISPMGGGTTGRKEIFFVIASGCWRNVTMIEKKDKEDDLG